MQSMGTASILSESHLMDAKTIVLPIVIFKHARNGNEEEQEDGNIQAQYDHDVLEQWVSSILLPHQKVVIVSHQYFIEEHPQVRVMLIDYC